jgi:hypothetical protein
VVEIDAAVGGVRGLAFILASHRRTPAHRTSSTSSACCWTRTLMRCCPTGRSS